MTKAVYESQGAAGVTPFSLAVQELLRAQPWPSWGFCSCELPATTYYQPAASTRERQTDERQSGMKKTKEKPRKENALLTPTQ